MTLLAVDPRDRRASLVVGALCRRGHEYTPGHSLRYLSGACVECQTENAKARRAANGPAMDAKRAEWAAKNPGKLKTYLATYRTKNHDVVLERVRKYQRTHRAERAAYLRRYRRLHPEIMKAIEARRVRSKDARIAFNEYRKRWAAANFHKIQEYAHKRSNVRLARLPSGTIGRIGSLQRWRCAYCQTPIQGGRYHKDHIVPLAKGGPHAPRNIQLLCPPCNLRKGTKNPLDFVQSLGFLL